MKIAVNLSILEKAEDLSVLLKTFDQTIITSIEMPIRMWQLSNARKETLNGLKIANFSNILHQTEIFPLSIFASEAQFLKQYEQVDEKLKICQLLGCKNLSLGIDPWTELDKPRHTFIKRVRVLALLAYSRGITINLEYISHIVAKNSGDTRAKNSGDTRNNLFCPSLESAIDLIKEIDLQNVKLLLDFIHWYCDGGRVSVASIADMVGFVHICDHEEKDPEKITDFYRVLPFEGKLPLTRFLNQVASCNRNGFVSIEVFRNDDYTPSMSSIQKSVKKTREVLEKDV